VASNWLVPRNGGVETKDAKFGYALNAVSRCSAATSGSPAMREAHSNRALWYQRQLLACFSSKTTRGAGISGSELELVYHLECRRASRRYTLRRRRH
jgi:hypothetical protein